MTTRLEDELTRLLITRAELIETAPAYRLAPDAEDDRLLEHPVPRSDTRWSRLSVLVAVAAVAAVLATLLGIYLATVRPARSSKPADGSSCDLAGSARFAAALRDGQLPSAAVVLSGAADGAVLVAIVHGDATAAVESIDPGGAARRLWAAAPGQRVQVIGNPSGAVGDDWAAFVLKPLHGAGTWQTLVAARRSGVVRSLQTDPGYRVSGDARTAPIVLGDMIQLLENSVAGSEQKVAQYWVDTPPDTPANGQKVSNATTLLPVGGNTVTIHPRPDHTVQVQFADPQYRPTTLEPAARSGYAFASDGTTLTWLSAAAGRRYLWHWAPGEPSPLRRVLPRGFTAAAAYGGVAAEKVATPTSRQRVLDVATGVTVRLPQGVSLVRVDADTAVLTMHPTDVTRYTRVPLSSLTTC